MTQPRRIGMMLDLVWPYKRHAEVFAGTQQYAQEHNWRSIVDEYVDDTLMMQEGSSKQYDGVIARVTPELAEQAARLNIPVVNVWFNSPVYDAVPGVFGDFKAAGRLRAEHLISRGHRHFGRLSFQQRGDEVEGQEFCRVVQEAGHECTLMSLPLEFATTLEMWRNFERSITDWMDQWQLPIGICVGAESMGRMVVQMCHERGWRVPEDVAIIAGQNEETLCLHPRPSLTSIEIGYTRIGYEAARLLDQLIDEKKQRSKKRSKKKQDAPPRHLHLPPQGLIVRESTDFHAVDDDVIRTALDFIARNYHRTIGPTDVAKALCMEPRTLHRRFLKILDRSVAAEIRRTRMERAKRELAQSDELLSNIARNAGFGDRMRMYDIFRRELGVTPSAYRKQRQPDTMLP